MEEYPFDKIAELQLEKARLSLSNAIETIKHTHRNTEDDWLVNNRFDNVRDKLKEAKKNTR